MLVNIQINAIICVNMKVNNSYCLLIRIKSTNFATNIKVQLPGDDHKNLAALPLWTDNYRLSVDI